MINWFRKWRLKRLEAEMLRLRDKAIQVARDTPDPHSGSKFIRAAATIVAMDILEKDCVNANQAIQAVAACTGVEEGVLAAFARMRDSDPIARLRVVMMEDVRATKKVLNSVEAAFWVLHWVWRDTPDLTDFGHAQPDADALVNQLREYLN